MRKNKRMTHAEAQAERDAFWKFAKSWQRKNGGTSHDASMAFQAQKVEAVRTEKERIASLCSSPAFKKYLAA